MEGFVRMRVRPWVRRLLTRSMAILPALLVISLASGETSGDRVETTVAAVTALAAQNPVDAAALNAAAREARTETALDAPSSEYLRSFARPAKPVFASSGLV